MLLEILEPYINLEYKNFHQKICHTNYEILGVKIPILRKVAKDLLKNHDYKDILNNRNDKYYETVLLEGLIIANAKINYEEKLKLITPYLSKIDNWAICDIFCGELKFVKKNLDKFYKYLLPILEIKKEYYQRFVLVMLLDYYINDNYIDSIFEMILSVTNEEYYVKMAIAWLISICLVKYYDKTLEFLINNKNNLDKWTYNKAIQKACESYRITNENKIKLKELKN